ncbi:hypothetical protein ANO14919_079410 [Xylariales sp. No.14919]|nr:hypothetical protein ANO14919_079410 [Xylariales sp. No.14919]
MAELALAVVPLIFQVFAGCMKGISLQFAWQEKLGNLIDCLFAFLGYQLLSEASHMPEDCEHIRVRLKTEQFRLLDWARIIQISEDDSTLVIGTAGRGLLLEVLHQQQELLLSFAHYEKQLTPITEPFISQTRDGNRDSSHVHFPESEDLLQRALSYIHATRNLPKRLRWVVHHKPKVEVLLGKLTNLNDFLAEFLDRNQVGKLLELQVRTNHEIMQLNSTIGQLLNILQAENSHASHVVGGFQAVDNDNTMLRDRNSGGFRHALQTATTAPPLENLMSLAQAKALNLVIREGRLADPLTRNLGLDEAIHNITSVKLEMKDFVFLDDLPELGRVLEEPRTQGIFRPNSERRYIWVEWRQMPSCPRHYRRRLRNTSSIAEEDAKITNRLSALVTMLHSAKNTGLFRAARCLGYFSINDPPAATSEFLSAATTYGTHYGNDDLEAWCGLVFEKPVDYDLGLRPISLLELLRVQRGNAGGMVSSSVPSLTQRAALALAVAENLERLHAVNWLHKGLRSYNILFFSRNDRVPRSSQDGHRDGRNPQTLDFGRPILSGFDYSRPTVEWQWTESATQNPAHDIYRQPEVQAGSSTADDRAAFKKSYDYYSLGVILLEIARWQPIDSILGVELQAAQPKHTMTVRKRLLEEEPHLLQDVKACMGDIMYSVIRVCLTGPEAFGLDKGGDETDPDVAVRLQRAFYSKVVEKLKMICI